MPFSQVHDGMARHAKDAFHNVLAALIHGRPVTGDIAIPHANFVRYGREPYRRPAISSDRLVRDLPNFVPL
jgi:hypothetical protein